VLVISFFALAVLWREPRLEHDDWRALPGGRGIASWPVQILCGIVGVGLLVVTVLAGYIGAGTALDNWAPTFIHQEVYVDNDVNKGLREPLRQFNLPSEPWLFVVNKQGKITARLEGSIGVKQFEDAVKSGL
jgi:hypothetical protein